jgi:hypothetical protein
LRATLALTLSHTHDHEAKISAAGVERSWVLKVIFGWQRRVVFLKLIVLCGGSGGGPLNCSAYTLSKRFSKNSHSRQEATQLIINVCRLKKKARPRATTKFAAAFGICAICAAAAAKWSDLHVLQLLGLNSLSTPILIVSSLDFPPKCVAFFNCELASQLAYCAI